MNKYFFIFIWIVFQNENKICNQNKYAKHFIYNRSTF